MLGVSQVGSFTVLDGEERKSTASAPCLAAGKFVPSFERVVVGLSFSSFHLYSIFYRRRIVK